MGRSGIGVCRMIGDQRPRRCYGEVHQRQAVTEQATWPGHAVERCGSCSDTADAVSAAQIRVRAQAPGRMLASARSYDCAWSSRHRCWISCARRPPTAAWWAASPALEPPPSRSTISFWPPCVVARGTRGALPAAPPMPELVLPRPQSRRLHGPLPPPQGTCAAASAPTARCGRRQPGRQAAMRTAMWIARVGRRPWAPLCRDPWQPPSTMRCESPPWMVDLPTRHRRDSVCCRDTALASCD